ncbi:autotransporter domain-containing protein [Methylocystis sp. IM4]
MPIGLNAPVTLSGRAGWSHDFADVNRFALVNFQGISRSNFWVEGARWPRNAASIGAKISLPLAQAKLFIRYDGMFANNANISSATGGISINF